MMRFRSSVLLSVVACSTFGFACSSSDKGSGQGEAGVGGAAATGGTTSTATGGGTNSASGGANGASGGSGGASGSTGSGGTPSPGTSKASTIAQKLGKSSFLIGMGNDLQSNHDMDGAYTLGTTLDLHYAYLTGLINENGSGWPDWNPGGMFVDLLAGVAKKHGVVPMFTLYGMAAHGENNKAALTDDDYMTKYWTGAKLMYQRLGVFDGPAVVNLEPDFWGFAEQTAANDPTTLAVHVTALEPDCASVTNDIAGMGKCLIILARKYAPKTIVGFHASSWADGDPTKVAKFLVQLDAGEGDFMTTDTLDRDAGCYEAHTDPNCQRGGTGYYWSDSDFSNHLAWVKTMTTGVGVPMLWWQTPFGVPSTTPGGTSGHYRDNRVQYFFSNVDKLIAAGGLGAVWGTGAGNQTDITTDGGQFKNAVAKYFGAPVSL
jgi:hypothetical protein